jgi:hypothetical protein
VHELVLLFLLSNVVVEDQKFVKVLGMEIEAKYFTSVALSILL